MVVSCNIGSFGNGESQGSSSHLCLLVRQHLILEWTLGKLAWVDHITHTLTKLDWTLYINCVNVWSLNVFLWRKVRWDEIIFCSVRETPSKLRLERIKWNRESLNSCSAVWTRPKGDTHVYHWVICVVLLWIFKWVPQLTRGWQSCLQQSSLQQGLLTSLCGETILYNIL
jgi:hypothetical protein